MAACLIRSAFGRCGTGPKCELLKRLVKDENRAARLLADLADDGCDTEALAGRLISASEVDRKNRHYAELSPRKLRRLSANLRWCSGEMSKPVTDAIENIVVLSKFESPNLFHALNNLEYFPRRGNFFRQLPQCMLEIAVLLDRGLEETPKLNSQRPYWDFLAWVVAQVKRETKREHYEELSELLDLLLEAKEKTPIGTELFKKNIQRCRKVVVGHAARTNRKKNQ